MKLKLIVPLLSACLLTGCLFGCSQDNKNAVEPVVLPDIFKGRNFAYGGDDPGVALIFDDNKNPEIQNLSRHLEPVDVEFELLPLSKKETDKGMMYFLPFKVTNQFIDDGYLKTGVEYKFWLSYNEPDFYAGASKNDPSLTEPEILLMEGVW